MFRLIILVSFCVCVLLNITNAARSIQKVVPTPSEFAGQPGCYNPGLNMVLPYEEPFYPIDGKTCMEYLCKTDGDTFIYTCGAIALQRGQERIEGDKSLPYPKCCDSVIFTGDTSEDY